MVLKRPSSHARSLSNKDVTSPGDSGRSQVQAKSAKLWLLCLIPALLLVLYAVYPAQEASTARKLNSGGLQLLSVEQGPVTTADSAVKRVALCFFGLTRSLNHTLASINENVIDRLKAAGYEVDVFLHTYNDVTHLTNGRTGEDDDLDTDQWHMLEPYDHVLTSQDDFVEEVQEKISRCVHHGTGWRHDEEWIQRSNVRNMLAQLNSVYEVGKLWEKHHPTRQYTAVLFARPDVRFACPFPTSILDNIQQDTVYAPDFALWRGINDRFHMLAPDAATVWKRRRFFATHMCRHVPIHSEIYTHAFANATGLAYSPIPEFGFVRVRSTGDEADLDAEFPGLCGAPVREIARKKRRGPRALRSLP